MPAPLGIDIGFGMIKWVDAQGRHGILPAAWVPHAAGAETWGLGAVDQPMYLDGRAFVAGEPAASRPGAHRPFADGRLADPEAMPLLAAALWATGAEGDVVLGSGTPLSAFAQERETARAALEGRTLHLGQNGQARTVRLTRLALRPQGVGAALHLALTGRWPNGTGYGLVVDVGTRTTDVLCLRLHDLAPLVELSFSIEAGVSTAAEQLASMIERATGHLPPSDIATAALTRPVTWHAQVVGGPEAAVEMLDALAALIRTEIARRMGADFGRVEAAALVGGGSVLLGSRLAGVAQGQIALYPEEALYTNALGFQHAAARLAGAS